MSGLLAVLTYGFGPKDKFNVVSTLNTLDHILDDVVVQSNGKSLRGDVGVIAGSAMQCKPILGHLERVHLAVPDQDRPWSGK